MSFNPFVAFYALISVIGLLVLGVFIGPFFVLMPDISLPSVVGTALYVLVFWVLMRALPWWRTGKKAGSGIPVLLAALWGALAVMPMVLPAETGISKVLQGLGLSFIDAAITGAFPEELGKVTGVVVVALICRHRCDRPWHLMLLGFACGVGFEIIENLSYGGTGALIDSTSDSQGAWTMWIQRSILGFALHPMLSALAGWGIGLALYSVDKSTAWRFGQALKWYLIAFLVHATWNLNWDVAGVPLMALVVMPILWIGLLVGMILIMRKYWGQMKADRQRPAWGYEHHNGMPQMYPDQLATSMPMMSGSAGSVPPGMGQYPQAPEAHYEQPNQDLHDRRQWRAP